MRGFLKDNLPESLWDRSNRGLHPKKDDIVRWQKILHKQGWIAPNWPEEYGGTGWSLTRKYIFNKEYNLSGAPLPMPFGLGMVGPVIYTFGTQAQKDRYLDDILESNTWWCQGYSEPNDKKPSRIEFVDALPYLASGKVDKVGLREPYWEGRARRV